MLNNNDKSCYKCVYFILPDKLVLTNRYILRIFVYTILIFKYYYCVSKIRYFTSNNIYV